MDPKERGVQHWVTTIEKTCELERERRGEEYGPRRQSPRIAKPGKAEKLYDLKKLREIRTAIAIDAAVSATLAASATAGSSLTYGFKTFGSIAVTCNITLLQR